MKNTLRMYYLKYNRFILFFHTINPYAIVTRLRVNHSSCEIMFGGQQLICLERRISDIYRNSAVLWLNWRKRFAIDFDI